jgi:hypothetical protein
VNESENAMKQPDMQTLLRRQDAMNRRTFLTRAAAGIGVAALGSLLGDSFPALASLPPGASVVPTPLGLPGLPHFPAKAKRVIYLFNSGGPSQMDMFDYKPKLADLRGQDLPGSIRMGQRLTGMTAKQATFPIAPTIFKFAQYGQSGQYFSELLPYTSQIADELCVIKSMYTEAINHDPAVTFLQSGSQIAGRPSIGSWFSYGLGSENKDQGVRFSGSGEPVHYLDNPTGVDRPLRREMIDETGALNSLRHDSIGDPEIATRISQYELAYRMQASVPELADISDEPKEILDMYGPDVRTPGTYAANCLLARRLAERDVRFIQVFHMGWDQHGNLPHDIKGQCMDTDQPSAALIKDLKQRGLLDDTLVVWGGEFGRTVYSQGTMTSTNYGRDHHPRCFSIWMAGGGVKPGITIGETDEYCYNITKDPVHVHDLHATILALMGVDHTRLTYKFQGRYFRLTDVAGTVVQAALA